METDIKALTEVHSPPTDLNRGWMLPRGIGDHSTIPVVVHPDEWSTLNKYEIFPIHSTTKTKYEKMLYLATSE